MKPQRKLALDLLEPGETTKTYLNSSKTIPSGITSKMLYKDIVTIAWPSLLELMLTQLASMVDMIMVGRLGASALTAVGLTTQPKFLIISIITSINVGTTALVARSKGQGKQEKQSCFKAGNFSKYFYIGIDFNINVCNSRAYYKIYGCY